MFKTSSKSLPWIVSAFCFLIFVCMENPSIYAKLGHTNTQFFSLSKSAVLIFSEIALWCCLLGACAVYWWYRIVLCFLLAISTIIFDTYFRASGKVIEFQEFLLLYQSKANLLDAISMYGKEILYSLPRVLILFAGFYLLPPPPLSRKSRGIAFLFSLLTFLGLVSLVFATCIFRQGAATNKLPTPVSLYGLFVAYSYDNYKNLHQYKYIQKNLSPSNKSEYQNIILVVDESVRWDYSPFLRIRDYKKWFVYDYGMATSYANSSAVSNILLRKGARFESLSSDFYENPLIWDYAKKAGYETYLYDNQGGGVGHDYFDKEEAKLIDHNLSCGDFKDADIWKSLSYLNGEQKTFTLIIKKGSHFPYVDFPQDQKIAFEMSEYQKATSMRIKYLKSIIFQSDDFWKDFFSLTITKPTLVIYTSDHGQNLEDVEGLTHGTSGQDPYKGEGMVPLVVLTNIQDLGFVNHLQENFNHSSHFNIFPTIIESMGYCISKLGYCGKNASLREQNTPVGGFFYGIPFGYFGKEADFSKIELKK